MSLKNTSGILGYVQLTSLATAVGLTVPVGATFAIIQAEAQAVRWRDDGTAPTATVGMTVPAGSELRYDGNLRGIQFIEAAASAKLNISFYS